MAQHDGRVVATDERNYVLRLCAGTLVVEPDRLVIQGEPHDNGNPRRPVLIERADVGRLHLKRRLFGAATLTRETPAGYRSDILRTRDPDPLLADLQAHRWPVDDSGRRRPTT